jgi:hypothetical protein
MQLSDCLHRWENTDSRRYYLAHLHIDLLGDVVISSYWGGLNSRLGGEKHEAMTSIQLAKTHLEAIFRTRAKHGYQFLNSTPPRAFLGVFNGISRN